MFQTLEFQTESSKSSSSWEKNSPLMHNLMRINTTFLSCILRSKTRAAEREMGFCKVFYLVVIIAAYASGSFCLRSLGRHRPRSAPGSDHMRVSWITEDFSVPSLVEYGTSPGKYTSSATGNNTSYSFVSYDSGSIHNVVIGPLSANTIYYYRCGGTGAEFKFKTSAVEL